MDTLAERISGVQERLALAAQRTGRKSNDITLVAVTKAHPPALIAAAYTAGLREFGENRVEEAVPKMNAAAAPEARWHMIGHVQSRKARDVAQAGADSGQSGFALVHSVDSLRLARRLSRFAQECGRVQPILLECNVSGEVAKQGFAAFERGQWSALLPDLARMLELPGVRVEGLMTMAPLVDDPEAARPYFRRLAELRDYLQGQLPQAQWETLSMGMTDDFEVAITEGSTLVRIGRAIFGERA